MGKGPTKSTRLVTATGPFHLLNHGLRSMFAPPIQRRDQGAFATRIRSLPNHIVMRSPSAYSRVARLMVPDLLHANRVHFYRDVGDICIRSQWIKMDQSAYEGRGFPALTSVPLHLSNPPPAFDQGSAMCLRGKLETWFLGTCPI
jgi:hypothetical protein